MPGPFPDISIALLAVGDAVLRRWRHQPVALPCWRLYWNPDRGASISMDDGRWPLDPDHLVLISPETVYQAEGPPRPHRHVFLHFTIAGCDWQLRPGIHRFPATVLARALVDELRTAMPNDHDRLRLTATSLCTHALALLPADDRRQAEVREPIQRCLDHLRAHFDRQVDNLELAAIADMHVNAFTRSFRASTGLSPQAWHHRHRIERAGVELVRTDASIDDIAHTFGYCDRHHFTRVFTRLRGRGPAAWRRAARSEGG